MCGTQEIWESRLSLAIWQTLSLKLDDRYNSVETECSVSPHHTPPTHPLVMTGSFYK